MKTQIMKPQEIDEEKNIFRLLDRAIDDMEEKRSVSWWSFRNDYKIEDWLWDKIKEPGFIVTWKVICNIIDTVKSLEWNFRKRVADNFKLENYSKIIVLYWFTWNIMEEIVCC